MIAKKTTTLVRAGVGVLTVALAVTPTLLGGAAVARAKKHHHTSSAPQFRVVASPDTFYPVIGTKRVRDLRSYSSHHRGTDISTSCGATVRASTPGTVRIATNPKWGGRVLARVVTNHDGLVTSYGWLWAASVQDGQIVQSGQKLGVLAGNPFTKRCTLYFSVMGGGHVVNPSSWLNAKVGTPVARYLFDTSGFTVASFNNLGASHTPKAHFPSYTVRTPGALRVLKTRGVDVAGMQEFEKPQADMLLADGTFKAYYGAFRGGKPDSRNAIIWRDSTMQFISGSYFLAKYFDGSVLRMPIVLLRQRSTGRTVYIMNTHNPATTPQYPRQQGYRNYDVGVEKAKMIELRASGRPVIFTGDFNDRQTAFCPLTADKLSISPNSIPSTTCAFPRQSSIDWIFAAGQVRFSTYKYDTYTKQAHISDHPIVYARAHLQD